MGSIDLFDDLKPDLPEYPGHVPGIVAGIGQMSDVFVPPVADDQGHPLGSTRLAGQKKQCYEQQYPFSHDNSPNNAKPNSKRIKKPDVRQHEMTSGIDTGFLALSQGGMIGVIAI
jgi:predicted NodU family carbamoyl transferase